MATFVLTLIAFYFMLKCAATMQSMKRSKEQIWDKIETCNLNLSTKDGAKLKVSKISDDEFAIDFTTKDGQNFKYPN